MASVKLIIVLVQLFLIAESASLTYILKRDRANLQPSCVAEGLDRYSAVGWIYPMPEDGVLVPNSTTKYIPSLQDDYNCKFSKNDKCNFKWIARDWRVDETSSRTREFIDDNRWEDLPVVMISNSSKEFTQRFYLENAAKVGFSVRSNGAVEVFLSTGWNPHNYPSYYFRIEQQDVYFAKFSMLTPEFDYKLSQLEYSKSSSNIIAGDEWRSFEIGVDETGNVTLIDKNNMDRLLISHVDKEPLKPSYMLIRSFQPSLWKIIQNYFMYTETAQMTRLGPQIQTGYKDLCVSLLVASCSNCKMSFFYMNGTKRQPLNQVPPTNEKWIEIKLKQENIKLSRFNLFIETEFVNGTKEESKGWWAYDNVRVCNENEVKVSYLKLNQTFAEDDSTVNSISCQLIKKPSFRPHTLEYDVIEDDIFPEFPSVDIISNDTSLTLKWPEEDPDRYLTYFIYYQGNDICSSSDIATSTRLSSGGFLTTKHNEIIIPNLIPYTNYNITLSSVLHENDKFLVTSTLATAEPKIEELPIQMHIRPLDSAVNVSWDKPSCNSISGPLIYNLTVWNENLNFTKGLDYQTGTTYLIEGLRPYTKHNLTVATARNARNLMRGSNVNQLTYEFVTLPALAPSVKNLELYAIGTNKAQLRYDLPSNSRGTPVEVQITKCNVLSFAKCKSTISRIARCPLWPQKMCADVDYLMPYQNYNFKVSLKNANTNAFGVESLISAETIERVPSAPGNVTYQVVDCHETIDYCHLNISWLHPYNPNATISHFNIILNSTYFNNSYSEEDQTMHEVLRIVNDTYLPRYTYQVKYVPYSHEYNLYLQSANSKYKSDFSTATVKTADLGDHIDQTPKLLGKGDKAIVFKLPRLDRRLDSYTLTVAVQDFNENLPLKMDSIENPKLADHICHPYGSTWISQVLKVKDNQTKTVTISGLDEKRAIKPNTKYCIIFIITNKYRGEEHDVVYYEKLTTPDSPSSTKEEPKSGSLNHLYMLLLLLLLVPIGFAVYWFIRRRQLKRPKPPIENAYETLPFEEHDKNYANRTYDYPKHK
ncbi:unnamed protein product [Ceutorhynchus assimilis]|uniref:Fibronectin type-III domain-containing protein n=1 Tax=Ceutorhynchus assimilis TaxID=467358 RepID=A0A9N9QNF4_9CUCU|nr:unnamed protein product [Ceutorhynchus assimilis]